MRGDGPCLWRLQKLSTTGGGGGLENPPPPLSKEPCPTSPNFPAQRPPGSWSGIGTTVRRQCPSSRPPPMPPPLHIFFPRTQGSTGIALFNVPFSFTYDEMQMLLVPYPGLVRLKWITEKNHFKGYAFAYFDTLENATHAKNGLEGLVLQGQQVDVKWADKRVPAVTAPEPSTGVALAAVVPGGKPSRQSNPASPP